MDLRAKLGLLVLENENTITGEIRIAQDQSRRTEVRQEAQRRMSKPKKVKVPKARNTRKDLL